MTLRIAPRLAVPIASALGLAFVLGAVAPDRGAAESAARMAAEVPIFERPEVERSTRAMLRRLRDGDATLAEAELRGLLARFPKLTPQRFALAQFQARRRDYPGDWRDTRD